MVLSVVKFVPAGLHVYQTLDGKINIKTQQLILYIYIFVELICDFSTLGQSSSLPTTFFYIIFFYC